jgi:hypothetical protein
LGGLSLAKILEVFVAGTTFPALAPKIGCSLGLRVSLNSIADQLRTESYGFGLEKLREDFLWELNENQARHQIVTFVCTDFTNLL